MVSSVLTRLGAVLIVQVPGGLDDDRDDEHNLSPLLTPGKGTGRMLR